MHLKEWRYCLPLPLLSLIECTECGCALGTVFAEMLITGRFTPHQINDHLVTLVHQMTNGHDVRQAILAHLGGRFTRLITAAECVAKNDEYLAGHVQAIKAPFGIR